MKIGKYEILVIVISLALVMFTIGFFAGRGSVDDMISVETQVADVSKDAALTADADDGEEDENVLSPSEKINLNTATEEELAALPGIGEVLAERILQYREKNGEFETISEVMNVSGIGDKKFNAIKDSVII